MALTAAELKDALSYAFAGRSVSAGDQLALATRLLPVAAALVTRYAPTAPAEIREEAEIRIAMFYAESRGGSASTDEVKTVEFECGVSPEWRGGDSLALAYQTGLAHR